MDNTVELRQATQQDAGMIRTLTREAYAKWVPLLGREPLPMTTDYNEAVKQHRFDLLYLDGKLVALIELIPHEDHLWIENVAVLPSYQGKGLGHRLMAHAEQVATQLNLSLLKLLTNGAFTENIRLYQKLGYRIDREWPFMGGVTVDMSKKLE